MAPKRRHLDSDHATGLVTAPGLPGGLTATSPEIVDEIQRLRVVDSLLAVIADRGYGATTISHICTHAHMSARTFSALFDSKDDCLLVAYRVLADRLGSELGDAWGAGESWPAKVRAAIAAAIAFASEHPDAARLLAVEVQAGGPEVHAVQIESFDRLAAKLREGREFYPAAAHLNPSTETVLVAGIVALVGNRLDAGQADALPALEPELVELALAPFVAAE